MGMSQSGRLPVSALLRGGAKQVNAGWDGRPLLLGVCAALLTLALPSCSSAPSQAACPPSLAVRPFQGVLSPPPAASARQ